MHGSTVSRSRAAGQAIFPVFPAPGGPAHARPKAVGLRRFSGRTEMTVVQSQSYVVRIFAATDAPSARTSLPSDVFRPDLTYRQCAGRISRWLLEYPVSPRRPLIQAIRSRSFSIYIKYSSLSCVNLQYLYNYFYLDQLDQYSNPVIRFIFLRSRPDPGNPAPSLRDPESPSTRPSRQKRSLRRLPRDH